MGTLWRYVKTHATVRGNLCAAGGSSLWESCGQAGQSQTGLALGKASTVNGVRCAIGFFLPESCTSGATGSVKQLQQLRRAGGPMAGDLWETPELRLDRIPADPGWRHKAAFTEPFLSVRTCSGCPSASRPPDADDGKSLLPFQDVFLREFNFTSFAVSSIFSSVRLGGKQ